MVEKTIGDLLFGNDPRSKQLQTRFVMGRVGSVEDANLVLLAIRHQEIRIVIDHLEAQMRKNANVAEYDFARDAKQYPRYALGTVLSSEHEYHLLFTEFSYARGLYKNVKELLEVAHPEYEWKSSTGSMRFVKRSENES